MKIAFIGGGKMVSNMVKGFNRGGLQQEQLGVWLRNKEKLDVFTENHSVTPLHKISDIATYDVVVLGILPKSLKEVANKLRKHVQPHQILISILGGVTIDNIDDLFAEDQKIVRVMPNTPVGVNQGVLPMSNNVLVSKKEKKLLEDTFEILGDVHWIDESLMYTMPGITGSSPAFIYMLIEAMADNAVSVGVDRETAYQMISEMLMGAATMVQETKLHPGVLKDQVTSPGGSTIQGVMTLEKLGFRNAIIEAMNAVHEKNK